MADITDPQAIRFVNEVIRPMAERLRADKARIDDAAITWFAGLNSTIGSSADDDIADGREAEGVSRLTAADVTNLMTQMITFQTQLDQAGVMGIITKPCVRPIEITLGD